MRTVTLLLLLVVAAALTGCGAAGEPVVPLTVADWQTLPVEKKYTQEALERLKEGNPTLHTPEGWEAFSRTTLVAARKRDFPNGKKRP